MNLFFLKCHAILIILTFVVNHSSVVVGKKRQTDALERLICQHIPNTALCKLLSVERLIHEDSEISDILRYCLDQKNSFSYQCNSNLNPSLNNFCHEYAEKCGGDFHRRMARNSIPQSEVKTESKASKYCNSFINKFDDSCHSTKISDPSVIQFCTVYAQFCGKMFEGPGSQETSETSDEFGKSDEFFGTFESEESKDESVKPTTSPKSSTTSKGLDEDNSDDFFGSFDSEESTEKSVNPTTLSPKASTTSNKFGGDNFFGSFDSEESENESVKSSTVSPDKVTQSENYCRSFSGKFDDGCQSSRKISDADLIKFCTTYAELCDKTFRNSESTSDSTENPDESFDSSESELEEMQREKDSLKENCVKYENSAKRNCIGANMNGKVKEKCQEYFSHCYALLHENKRSEKVSNLFKSGKGWNHGMDTIVNRYYLSNKHETAGLDEDEVDFDFLADIHQDFIQSKEGNWYEVQDETKSKEDLPVSTWIDSTMIELPISDKQLKQSTADLNDFNEGMDWINGKNWNIPIFGFSRRSES